MSHLELAASAAFVLLAAVSLACYSKANATSDAAYLPLAYAMAQLGVDNAEAPIPSQCYTKTDGVSNPCWTCHTRERYPNMMADVGLQLEYSFSDVGERNHWRNLFKDRRSEIAEQSDEEILSYVREDNYEPFRQRMAALREQLKADDYVGYVPDIDLARGFDDEGFAQDGSGWRAFRYKPFLGTFWPTNGATDDVFVRLPERYRTDAAGEPSRETYRANLAIVEMAMATPPDASEDVERIIEPVDERAIKVDLDQNGEFNLAQKIVGTPKHYVGAASSEKVSRGFYPKGIEFLHSVRYLDPDAPDMIAARMKELRYSRKRRDLDRWAVNYAYEQEFNEKEEGNLPVYGGSAKTGLLNSFGWQLQGFIEDADGRLRLQSKEEHRFCMGCHSTVGITADQTFAFPRKVPGAAGWGYQSLKGSPDVPQVGHEKPEILTYFERVGGGDEFRANTEMLDRFFKNGSVDEAKVLRAAPGGPDDIRALILPSRGRALLLNKAYRALVFEQSFIHGRDTVVSPTKNVHERIDNGNTGLAENARVFADGRLHLQWEWTPR